MSTESLRSASDRTVLTRAQRALLRKALDGGSENGSGSSASRHAIRELCTNFRDSAQGPERLLIAFKASLVDAANEAQVPYGPQRSELLSRLVSVFIEELYGFSLQRGRPADRQSQQQL